MTDGIDPIGAGLTPQLVQLALDGALARHAAIATNIANAQTDSYRPLVSRFDSLLEDLRTRVLDRSQDAGSARVMQSVHEALTGNPVSYDPRTDHVELDMQVAALARNTLQYEALLAAQGKLGQMMQLVIGEGKM
jgi:flagellar basal-body rod protein FlgB